MKFLNKTFETFDGLKLKYRIKRNKKPFLVFLPGFFGNSSVWVPVLRYFEKKGYSTLTFDFRGHGFSDKPRRKRLYRFENFVKDLDLLLKKENIKNFIFIGYSTGGQIAVHHQAKFKKARKMVLISTNYENPGRYKYDLYLLTIPTKILCFIFAPILGIIRRKGTVVPDYTKKYGILSSFYHDMLSMPWDITIWLFLDLIDIKLKPLLKKIKIPVLVLRGSRDWLTTKTEAELMEKDLKKGKLKIVPETGHHIVIHNPKKLIKFVEVFV